jgi:hypothetical protein
MRSNRTQVRATTTTLLGALLALAPLAPAAAQDEVTEVAVAEVEEEEADASRWSGVLQVDFTNAYFFRGMLNERADTIVQPWGELYLNLFGSDEGLIRDVTVGVGSWSSIHDDKTGYEHSPSNYYELDLYPMLSIGLPGGVTWTTTYYWYISPNGAFDTVEELNFKLEWDDSEYLPFALAPWINWAVETDRSSNGNDRGAGVQMGLEPTLFELDHKDFPLAISAPQEIGLSINDYYENDDGSDETFGYFSTGITNTLPLPFIDKSFGAWSLILSGKLYAFGDSMEELNKGDSTFGVVMGSVGVEF